MSAQQRLKSACAYEQSDLSLRYPHEDILHPWLSKICPVKILIRLTKKNKQTKNNLSDGMYVRLDLSFRCSHIPGRTATTSLSYNPSEISSYTDRFGPWHVSFSICKCACSSHTIYPHSLSKVCAVRGEILSIKWLCKLNTQLRQCGYQANVRQRPCLKCPDRLSLDAVHALSTGVAFGLDWN